MIPRLFYYFYTYMIYLIIQSTNYQNLLKMKGCDDETYQC